MSKILTSIGVIAIVISFYLIGYLLYQNDDQKFQITQENIQNIFQKINSKKKLSEKKNPVIKLLFISLLELLVIVIIVFLSAKYEEYCKKKKDFEKKICSGEQVVENFIKVKTKGKNLLEHGFQFVASIIDMLDKDEDYDLSIFDKNDYLKIEEEYRERFFVKISKVCDIKVIFDGHKNHKNLEDLLLNLLESTFNDEYQIKKKFQGHENLLNLILIVRLGIFGNLDAVNKAFQTGLLKDENLKETEDEISFLNYDEETVNNFFKFDEETVKKNNEDFFADVNKIWNDKNDYLEERNEFLQNLSSLIGSRESSYRVNESSFNYLRNSNLFFLLMKFNKKLKKKIFFSNCTTFFFFCQKIQSILRFFSSAEELNDDINLPWRFIIKKMLKASEFFVQIRIEMWKEKNSKN